MHTKAHMNKTSAISVRVSDDIKQAAEAAAASDRRSLASLVEKILAEWLTEHGYLGKAKGRK
jgi:predicted HicB family RNase H-like nuclease